MSSTLTLTEAKNRQDTFTYAIHNNLVNQVNERRKMSICGLFCGDRNKFVGHEALKEYYEQNGQTVYLSLIHI